MSIARLPLGELLERIGARTPTPGGGAVAGATGAIAAALAGMVVAYSIGKRELAEHEAALRDAASRLQRARELLLRLADEDAEAYDALRAAQKSPGGAGEAAAVRAAVDVPRATLAACTALLRLVAELVPITNPRLRSDLAIAGELAAAGARAGAWNVRANASLVAEGERGGLLDEAAGLTAEADRLRTAIDAACGS